MSAQTEDKTKASLPLQTFNITIKFYPHSAISPCMTALLLPGRIQDLWDKGMAFPLE